MPNLFESFQEVARRYQDHSLIHQYTEEYQRSDVSYGKVLRESKALAKKLTHCGIRRGDRIALISENRWEWLAVFFAALSQGIVVVPLDPRLTSQDWMGFMSHAGVKAAFLSESSCAAFKDQGQRLKHFVMNRPGLVFVLGDGIRELENASDNGASVLSAEEEGPAIPENLAVIIYTSGTTGKPKGVMLTHDNILSNAQSGSASATENSRWITILPLYHMFGLMAVLSVIFRGGASVAFYPKLDGEKLLKSFREIRPEGLICVPVFLEKIALSVRKKIGEQAPKWFQKAMRRWEAQSFGESGFRRQWLKKKIFRKVHDNFGGGWNRVVCGGAPLDPCLARFFHTLGVQILEGYGLTETSPAITSNSPLYHRVGTVGKAMPHTSIRIVNPQENGVGEITVKGRGVMKGYFRDAEETEKVLDEEGWFCTGDLGHLDSDGFLYVSGRLKELIVTPNGKNIHPAELEHHFTSMPYVKELCVFGVPLKNKKHGELVHIQIVPDTDALLKAGHEDVAAFLKAEVTKAAQLLPEYKRPKSIGFSHEPFPRSASLKVRKFLVRDEWLLSVNQAPKAAQKSQKSRNDAFTHDPLAKVITKILSAFLPRGTEISEDSSFELDLGLDSLTLIEFWATVQKTFGIQVQDAVMHERRDVHAVMSYLKELPDFEKHLQMAISEIKHEGSHLGSWNEILGENELESGRKASKVLKQHPLARRLFLAISRFAFRKWLGIEVRGLENLPRDGAFILAPNHECYLDNLFVAAFLPRGIRDRMAVVGAKEFFDKLGTRLIAKLARVIPIDRKKVSSEVLQVGAQVLKSGHVLLIHPEGTRSPDGELLPFKEGAAILADYVQCPIVPVYIEGAHEFWPKDASYPKSRHKITVVIGQPIRAEAKHGETAKLVQEDAHRLTDRLEKSVRFLKDCLLQEKEVLDNLSSIERAAKSQVSLPPRLGKTSENKMALSPNESSIAERFVYESESSHL